MGTTFARSDDSLRLSVCFLVSATSKYRLEKLITKIEDIMVIGFDLSKSRFR